MKQLIVEDDFLSRKLLNKFLSTLGEVDIAINGKEAIEAVRIALEENQPYDLICLDIMMPVTDGLSALKQIRRLESERGLRQETRAKIIMTTALSDKESVISAAKASCDAYIIKPVTRSRLFDEIRRLGIGLDTP